MKKVFGIGVIVAVLAVVVAGRQVFGADNIQAQIEAANQVFMAAFAKKDVAGVAACYTTDAQVFPTGQDVVKGNAAIAAYWKAGMEGPATQFALTTLEAEQHGDTAIEVGQATIKDAQGATLDIAKYIVIWKRVDGKWKLHRDIFNSNGPVQ